MDAVWESAGQHASSRSHVPHRQLTHRWANIRDLEQDLLDLLGVEVEGLGECACVRLNFVIN